MTLWNHLLKENSYGADVWGCQMVIHRINPLMPSRMGQYSRVIDTVDNVTKECLRYDKIKMDAHSILFI